MQQRLNGNGMTNTTEVIDDIDTLVHKAELLIERRDAAAFPLVNIIMEGAVKSGNMHHLARARYIMACYYCIVANEYDKAIELCNEALQNSDEALLNGTAHKIYKALGNSYQLKGELFSAQIWYMEGIKNLEQKHHLDDAAKNALATFYYNNSIILNTTDKTELAEEHLGKAIGLYEQIGADNKLSKCYSAYANVWESKKDFYKALQLMHKALELDTRFSDAYRITIAKANIGILYSRVQQFGAAEQYLADALEYFENNGRSYEAALVKSNLGEILFNLGRVRDGIHHVLGAERLFEALDNKRELANIYQTLSKFMADTGDFKLALEYQQKYSANLKMVFDIEKTNALVRAREEFNIKQKEYEAALLRQKNEEIKTYTSRLESANKDLEAFGYSVSHDLRTPLRNINGFCKILVKRQYDKLDSDGKELLQTISDDVVRMNRLIDELLRFSRIEKVVTEKKAVDIEQLVQVVINQLRSTVQNQNTVIKAGPMLPAVCNPILVNQVFTNIIGNAIKYSSRKSCPVIEIGSRTENGVNLYYVKDNGAGFNMQNAGQLFGIFKRLHPDSEFEGTGVGLAIVHRIMTAHAGRIWAESAVDEGATFYFTLP